MGKIFVGDTSLSEKFSWMEANHENNEIKSTTKIFTYTVYDKYSNKHTTLLPVMLHLSLNIPVMLYSSHSTDGGALITYRLLIIKYLATWMCVCVRACSYVYICVSMLVYCSCVYIAMCVCVCVCVCVCACVCVCV